MERGSSEEERRERIERALTSVRRVAEYHTSETCPATLLRALRLIAPEISEDDLRRFCSLGAVYVNGVRAREELELRAPIRVEIFLPKSHHPTFSAMGISEGEAGNAFGGEPDPHRGLFTPDHVVMEDEDLLVAWKEPGISSMPTRDQQFLNLKRYLDEYVGSPVHMPSRLDTSACGLVVVSKSKRAHRNLQHAFEFGRVQKYYLLHVSPAVSWSEVGVSAPIGKSDVHPVLRAVVAQGGRAARTEFIRADVTGVDGSILLAKPYTGRTHQLRVHTSYLGSPIVGDNFYGGREQEELRLLAFAFLFSHPVTNRSVRVCAPRDRLPPWARPAERWASNWWGDLAGASRC